MTKHTPGPWKIFKGHSGYTWFIVFNRRKSGQRSQVTHVYKGPKLVRTDGVEAEALASVSADSGLNYEANKQNNLIEGEANARLIAAAPDLLEAARRIVDEFGHTGKITEDSARVLQAAVTKATGETYENEK